jgi:hypothetical protein
MLQLTKYFNKYYINYYKSRLTLCLAAVIFFIQNGIIAQQLQAFMSFLGDETMQLDKRRDCSIHLLGVIILGLASSQLVHIPSALAVNESANEIPYFNSDNGTFAVFSKRDNSGIPIRLGRYEQTERGIRIISEQNIEASGNIFIFSDPQDEKYLLICEKLPAGGFGRILRYRGRLEDGGEANLEFIYDDKNHDLTLLDYSSGKFYSTTFSPDRVVPPSFSPFPFENQINPEAVLAGAPTFKFPLFEAVAVTPVFVREIRIHSVSDLVNDQKEWTHRLVRGPPLGGIAL